MLCAHVSIQPPLVLVQMYYRICGNFRGMKFSLNRKQTGFSLLYFHGSQVHRGKVACYVLLQISNCCKLAKFHGLNFHCISRWPRNPQNLHTTEISVHTVCVIVTMYHSNCRTSWFVLIHVDKKWQRMKTAINIWCLWLEFGMGNID